MLLTALIRIFHKHTKDARVILPLLVTIDKLLSHGSLDNLLNNPSSNFASDLVACVRKESSRCSDIKRLMAVVPVALGSLNTSDITLVRFSV
jgi:hypothetical protein